LPPVDNVLKQRALGGAFGRRVVASEYPRADHVKPSHHCPSTVPFSCRPTSFGALSFAQFPQFRINRPVSSNAGHRLLRPLHRLPAERSTIARRLPRRLHSLLHHLLLATTDHPVRARFSYWAAFRAIHHYFGSTGGDTVLAPRSPPILPAFLCHQDADCRIPRH
jgi:hypothetical protein